MSPLCSSPCSSSATSFRRLSLAAAMADAEAARGERLVRSGSSGASGARGTCGTQRDARRVSPAEKELGVCRRGRDGARCDRRRCARSGPRAGSRL